MVDKICTGLVTAGFVAICGAATYALISDAQRSKKNTEKDIKLIEEETEDLSQTLATLVALDVIGNL